MIELSGNIKKRSKSSAEDTASYMLYKFDRSVLDGRAVPMERLSRCLGLEVACEYISGDCTEALGIVAFEPQRLYVKDGCIDLQMPTAVVERDIIDRGESGLYSLALAFMCAEMLYYGNRKNVLSGQMSFGLDSIESENHRRIVLTEQFDKLPERDSAASFALKLLLPKNGFKRQVVELYSALGVNRATLDRDKQLPDILRKLAKHYVVPEVAVLARLTQLNL